MSDDNTPRTVWIETEEGLFMEIHEPDSQILEVLRRRDLDDAAMVEAMRRYVEKRYLGREPDELDSGSEMGSGDSGD